MRLFTHLFFHSFSVRRCSSLAAPQFGFIYPYMCTSFPVSGTVCHLQCRNGFIGNGGVNEMRCGKNGKWSSNKSLILQCLGTILCYSFLQPRCSVSHVWYEKVFAKIYRIVCRFLTYKKSWFMYRMLFRVTRRLTSLRKGNSLSVIL